MFRVGLSFIGAHVYTRRVAHLGNALKTINSTIFHSITDPCMATTSCNTTPGGVRQSPNPLKRKSIVYVEIPPSPFHGHANSPSFIFKRKRAESIGTPLANKVLDANRERNISGNTPLKTKLSGPSSGELVANTTKATVKSSLVTSEAAVPQFPNGYFYCHQCSRKRDPSGQLKSYSRVKFAC